MLVVGRCELDQTASPSVRALLKNVHVGYPPPLQHFTSIPFGGGAKTPTKTFDNLRQ